MKYAIKVITDTTMCQIYEIDLSDIVFLAKLTYQINLMKCDLPVVEVIGVNEMQKPDDSICYWSSLENLNDNANCIDTLSRGYISEIYSNAVDFTIPTPIDNYTIGIYCYYSDDENYNNPTIGAIDYNDNGNYIQFTDNAFTEKERHILQSIVDQYDFDEFQFGHDIVTNPTVSKSSIVYDLKGRPIVIISDVRYKGRRHINWNNIKNYVKEYVRNNYKIVDTSEKILIGSTLVNEIKGSEDTHRLRGANINAKANATTEIPMLLRIASNKRWQKNYKTKHKVDAAHGWYRFTSRFAIPVYYENGEVERYNVFRIEMLVRRAADGNLYLYDMVNVKKETSNLH